MSFRDAVADGDATADAARDVTVDATLPPIDAGRDVAADVPTPPGDAARDVIQDTAPDVRADARDGGADGDAAPMDTGVDAPLASVLAVEGGELFACALRVDGSVWCWGSNDMAELGAVPSAADFSCAAGHCNPTPQRIPVVDDATEISLGIEFGCAIRADRSVWCWGKNDYGELGHTPGSGGDGTCAPGVDGGAAPSACNALPQKIGLPAGVKAAHVSAGWGLACVQTEVLALGGGAFAGDVYCWGNNAHDTVGLPASAGAIIPTPNKIAVFASDVVHVSVSGDTRHACALRHDGSVWCWGDDYGGRIGALDDTGPTGGGETGYDHPTPVNVRVELPADAGADGDVGLGGPLAGATAVAVGDGASYALLLDGTVWAWGTDELAGLGNRGPYDGTQHPGARRVPGLPANIVTLLRHWRANLVIDGAGAVYGWGDNSYRELADSRPGAACDADAGTCLAPPVALPRLSGAVSLATGFGTGVVLDSSSKVLAWGGNDHAQLGHLPGTQGDQTCVGVAAGPCNATPSEVLVP